MSSSSNGLVVSEAAVASPIAQDHQAIGCRSRGSPRTGPADPVTARQTPRLRRATAALPAIAIASRPTMLHVIQAGIRAGWSTVDAPASVVAVGWIAGDSEARPRRRALARVRRSPGDVVGAAASASDRLRRRPCRALLVAGVLVAGVLGDSETGGASRRRGCGLGVADAPEPPRTAAAADPVLPPRRTPPAGAAARARRGLLGRRAGRRRAGRARAARRTGVAADGDGGGEDADGEGDGVGDGGVGVPSGSTRASPAGRPGARSSRPCGPAARTSRPSRRRGRSGPDAV